MKVRCVNADGVLGLKIQVGCVYEVVKETNGYYYLEGKFNGFFKTRFELVDEATEASPPKSEAVAAPTSDLDEERCWNALRPRREPGHCACGCARELCRFHRDDAKAG